MGNKLQIKGCTAISLTDLCKEIEVLSLKLESILKEMNLELSVENNKYIIIKKNSKNK